MTHRSQALFSVSLIALMAWAQPAWTAQSPHVALDMPAQPLATALDQLALQSHTQLLYAAEAVRGLTAPALKGDLAIGDALHQLLAGSGFEARTNGDNAFVVIKAPTTVSRLETVTVIATRTENRAFDVPASVTTVTRDQIDDSQAKDIATIIRDIPGVTMGGTPREGGQLPTIRGYQGPDIILRVDDARRSLDASVGIFTPLYLDPNFVKQVDVVRGPSSATYGGGGLGGVMAFQTIDADTILASGQNVGGRIKAGWHSGDGSLNTNLSAAARQDGASVLASGTLRNYHNINDGADGENVQNGTATNGLFKLGFAPNDLNALQASYMRYFDAGFGPTNPASNDTATTGFKYTERSQDEFTGRWTFRDSGKELWDGKVSAFYTDLKYDGQTRSTTTTDFTLNAITFGGSAQNSSRFETAMLKHRLTYGLDGYQDELSNTSAGASNGVNPDGTMQAGGGFLQDEIQLTPAWTLTPTFRYDSYKAEAGSNPSNSSNHLSPKLAVRWQALSALSLFASYGEAFRAPTLTELYMQESRSRSFMNFAPNATLKPETSRAKELGFTVALDDVIAAHDAFRFKAVGFDESVKDLINQATIGTYARTAAPFGTGSIFQYQNVSNAHRWGGEAELSYRLGDWDFGLGYSRLRVKDRSTGNNLFAPPDKLTASLAYFVDDFLSLRYGARLVAAQDYDSTTLRRRDGYSVHDIGASYDRDSYRIDFGISNLFDKGYASYHQGLASSYIYEEGRSFNLSLTARF